MIVDRARRPSDGVVRRRRRSSGCATRATTEVERYLVGSIEERRDDVAVISPGSPLGQALLGQARRRAGGVRGAERPAARSRSSRSTGRTDGPMAARRCRRRSGTATSSTRGDGAGEPDLLYIDLHLVHEVTSPQAFEGLRLAGRTVRRPDLTVATADHNVPTDDIDKPGRRPDLAPPARGARGQLRRVRRHLLPDGRREPGHRPRDRPGAGPHPAGHDDRLRRQPHLDPRRLRRARLRDRHLRGRARARHPDPPPAAAADDGGRGRGRARRRASRAKDVVLAIIGRLGTGGGIGHVIEYRGAAIRVALDGGPDDGLQHVDRGRAPAPGWSRRTTTTFAYLEGRAHAPKGAEFDEAVEDWRALATDDGRRPSTRVVRSTPLPIRPHVTWGTNPGQVVPIDGVVPDPADLADPAEREAADAGARLHGPRGRHADPRHPGRHGLHRLVHQLPHRGPPRRRPGSLAGPPGARRACAPSSCPGSRRVKAQAEAEGLDEVFLAAGFEWREAGCSMCLGDEPRPARPRRALRLDLEPQLRGPPGPGGRTHLVSPAVAAATAVAGHFATPDRLG